MIDGSPISFPNKQSTELNFFRKNWRPLCQQILILTYSGMTVVKGGSWVIIQLPFHESLGQRIYFTIYGQNVHARTWSCEMNLQWWMINKVVLLTIPVYSHNHWLSVKLPWNSIIQFIKHNLKEASIKCCRISSGFENSQRNRKCVPFILHYECHVFVCIEDTVLQLQMACWHPSGRIASSMIRDCKNKGNSWCIE